MQQPNSPSTETYAARKIKVDDMKSGSPTKVSQRPFNWENVKSDPNIKKVDVQGELELFNHVNVDGKSDSCTRQCRGSIFTNKGELVLAGFPFMSESTSTNEHEFNKSVDISTCKFYTALEGTLIRVFHYSGKWYISTRRKINAENTGWTGTKTFGQLFNEALLHEYNEEESQTLKKTMDMDGQDVTLENVFKMYTSHLDVKKCYMFLLLSTQETRIVCRYNPKYNRMYHIGTMVQNDLDCKIDFDSEIGVSKPERLDLKLQPHVVLGEADFCDHYYSPGIVCFDADGRHHKIVNVEYEYLSKLRNNNPSVVDQYFDIRLTKHLHDYTSLYADYIKQFEDIENIIYNLACLVQKIYRSKYIHKNKISVSPQMNRVIYYCHMWYKLEKKSEMERLAKNQSTRQRKIHINTNIVINSLNTFCTGVELATMISKYREKMVKHGIENTRDLTFSFADALCKEYISEQFSGYRPVKNRHPVTKNEKTRSRGTRHSKWVSGKRK